MKDFNSVFDLCFLIFTNTAFTTQRKSVIWSLHGAPREPHRVNRKNYLLFCSTIRMLFELVSLFSNLITLFVHLFLYTLLFKFGMVKRTGGCRALSQGNPNLSGSTNRRIFNPLPSVKRGVLPSPDWVHCGRTPQEQPGKTWHACNDCSLF